MTSWGKFMAAFGALAIGPLVVPTAAGATVALQTTTSVACNVAGQVELTAHVTNTGTEVASEIGFLPRAPISDVAVLPGFDTTLEPGASADITFRTGTGHADPDQIIVTAAGGFVDELAYPGLNCGGTAFALVDGSPIAGPVGTQLTVSGTGCPPEPGPGPGPGGSVQFAVTSAPIGPGTIAEFGSDADGNWSGTYTVPPEADPSHEPPAYPLWVRCRTTDVVIEVSPGFQYLRTIDEHLPPVPVTRIAGGTRYDTAAAVSAATFTPGVAVAYVATGIDFADALAGTPIAVHDHAPILLTEPGQLPTATATELQRLQPQRIVVLGGTKAVGPAVLDALGHLTAGTVERLAGGDRFATAAAIADRFPTGGPVAYVATGADFPDALAGGPAAGAQGGPLLLVARDAVPASTAAALARLAPQRIVVLGGTGAVDDDTVAALGGLAPSVARAAGDTRFATSVAVSAGVFPGPTARVYLATGSNFPDALAGGVAAGSAPAPVLLVARACIPREVAAEVRRLGPTDVVVLGGTDAVGPEVAALGICA